MTTPAQLFDIDSHTDAGNVRPLNEDAIAESFMASQGYMVLADGMGGHNAGDIASQYTVNTLNQCLEPLLKSQTSFLSKQLRHILTQYVHEVSASVFNQANADADKSGMGCTLVLNYLYDNQLMTAHVGDSRCYLLRDGQLTQLTKDHSLIQYQIDQGLMNEEEAAKSPIKNQLVRAIGIEAEVNVDIIITPLQPGDIIISASDGLTENMQHQQLTEYVNQSKNEPSPAYYLVEQAKLSGSRDNISVQYVCVNASFLDTRPMWYKRLIQLYHRIVKLI